MCLLLPFLSKLWGVPFHVLPTYIKDGAACFLNMGSISGIAIFLVLFKNLCLCNVNVEYLKIELITNALLPFMFSF